MPDDLDRASRSREGDGRPEYKVYRSRPRFLKGPGRAGEPGFDDLREARSQAGQQRERRWTRGRVARYVLVALAGWLLLSLLLFMVSAELQRDQVAGEARKALDQSGLTLTAASTVLVLGSDARPARARDCPESGCGPARSDTIMLMRTGPGHSARLSIPRDTIVDIPGHGLDKVNAAYAIGGPALAISTVKRYLGIEINHLVEVNFDNFPDFIDSLGGINVDTGCVLSNINGGKRNGGFTLDLKPGKNHIDGPQALALARTRVNQCPGSADDDLTRARRQQQILSAVKGRLVSPTTFVRLPLVSWQAPKTMRTDMSGPSLLGMFANMATSGSPAPRVLRPSGDEVLPDGGSGLVVSGAEKRAEVRRFLTG